MTYEAVADGDLAAVVTFLEMRDPAGGQVPNSPLSMRRIGEPSADNYRALFRRVGARWLWFSRLIMPDEVLMGIIGDPAVELYAVLDAAGGEVGILELDFRTSGECELVFVGLVPELSGQGHGKWLLVEALRRAWRDDVERVHVHTCSLDHPAALPAYRRAGFTAWKRAIERFPDPRLAGILPRDCAPQVPLLGTVTPGESRSAS